MAQTEQQKYIDYPFLRGGGEMGKLIRSLDWDSTALGSPRRWNIVLKQTVGMMLKTNLPVLVCWGPDYIQLYNDAFRPINGAKKHPQALGGCARNTYAEIWDTIGPMFKSVMAGNTVGFPDFLVPLDRNGYLEDRYFDFSYSPISDIDGNIHGVLVICIETTEKVRAINGLKISQENIRNMVRQAPVGMCIIKGEPLYVEEVNNFFLEIVGKSREEFKTAPFWEVNTQAKAFYKPIADQVMKTGNTYRAKEHELMLIRKGNPETVYVDFVFEPMRAYDGSIHAIMIVVIDVTDKVIARREQQSINEELAAANEELITTNDELATMQNDLQQLYNNLAASESRFRFLVKGAPVAIGVLNGPELIIETANDMILNIWNKSKKIVGMPLAVALPELKGQPYLQLLQDVYTSGKAYYGTEAPALLEHDGELQEFYFNFIYQPLNDQEPKTIMILAIDVTAHVNARREMERAFEQARLSKEAAELGTFDMNLEKATLEWDERCRTLFGISHNEPVSYEDDFVLGLHPDDRERVLKLINNVFIKSVSDGDYDVEYRTIGLEDQKLRWVRAKGKVYFDKQDTPVRFIGSVLDITEQKLDEIRKNDFIGMVSHELKTPLTSLTAYLQMLLGKADKSDDTIITEALEKSNNQVKKMSNMINGFLNISRLESGKLLIEKQKFELTGLIHEMIDEAKLVASTYLINFSDCELLEVYADRDKIGSVISNLLSNAVKYSPKGKHIDMQCQNLVDRVKVSVKDEGMGIKPLDIDKLFDRYYRVESKHTTTISGFGIGLYLSAEIIHRHDGKIGVESKTGVGSTFWFTLPIHIPQQLSVNV